jgi:hypothetical protein
MSESTANSPILRTPNNQTQEGTVTFTLKPRTRKVRLSETTVVVNLDDTQHDLCKKIAKISRLPINRLRITFENSARVVDARTHPQDPPKVRDIAAEGTVLVVKDLGNVPEFLANHRTTIIMESSLFRRISRSTLVTPPVLLYSTTLLQPQL